jgi:nicotinamidase-related amidase
LPLPIKERVSDALGSAVRTQTTQSNVSNPDKKGSLFFPGKYVTISDGYQQTLRWSIVMLFSKDDTALVVIDPQNDVLSEKGVSWALVGDSVRENNTVENLGRLFQAAKDYGFGVFVSPHYLYPFDQAWQFGGAVEKMMLEEKEFFRPDPLSLDGLSGSGADWLERYKPFIEDGQTVVVSPHKVWGPQSNDLVLQLRKRGIGKIILAGMLANLCVESHLRELLEQGFEVAVVKDATAAPRHPVLGDGYQAAIVNYGFIANAVLTTDDAVKAMR